MLADEALQAGISGGIVGRTERDVARVIEDGMRRGGGEPAFPTIVAAGENGASPHAAPRDVAIEVGQLVTIDYGVQLDGYCSDCTRTFAAGPVIDSLRDIYALVERAQAAASAGRRSPARTGSAVDAVARDVIAAAGHGEHFGHSLGHGVGPRGPRGSAAGQDRQGRRSSRQRRHRRARRLRARPGRRAHRGPRRGDRRRARAS